MRNTTPQPLRVLALAIAICACSGWVQAQSSGSIQDLKLAVPDHPNSISPTNVDLTALKPQLEAFQATLNRTIQQSFEQPFSLLQDAKGIYLPGFGVAFHMEVNLQPARLMMPFDITPISADELRKAKLAKIERIRVTKARLSQLLLEQGPSLTAVAPEQNIAIVVHLFNLPSEARDLPSQLVITVNRRALLDYQAQRMTADEFQKAGLILEF